MTMLATDNELGDGIYIIVQHEAILTSTVVDSTVLDPADTTVAEFQNGATAAALPEIIHLHGLPPIIDVGVSSEPICSDGDTTALVGNHDPVAQSSDVQALPGALLPRRDNVRGDPVSGAVDVEGIFSITLSREYRSVDVDLGWGIVVGGLSRDDFNEILAFPRCFE